MILTEKEAAGRKSCVNWAANNADRIDNCKGTGCMAWRWYENAHHRVESKTLAEVTAAGCEECATAFSAAWHLDGDRYRCPKCRSMAVKVFEEPERRRGYCGLAGRVEVR